MNVSIVLAIESPGTDLGKLLSALRFQTYQAFEVVLVTGGPGPQRAAFAGKIKVIACQPWNLARARNVGAANAAGEVVAFLDPGVVPDTLWLQELIEGYNSGHVAAVGGPVAHSGDDEPCYAADRLGNRLDAVDPPYWAYQIPFADRYVCLHRDNCSFRRSAYLEVGGYDEDLGDELQQADLCMRLTDRGYLIQPLPAAVVYQIAGGANDVVEEAASRRNKVRFAVRSTNPLTIREEVLRRFEVDDPEDDQDRALWEGIALAIQDRPRAALLPTPAAPFVLFPTLETTGRRLTLCFTVGQSAPTSNDAASRHSVNLARGLSERGHEIHLFVGDANDAQTQFVQGVWLHRVIEESARGVGVYRAFAGMAQTRFIDLIIGDDDSAVYCTLDRSLNCAISLTADRLVRHQISTSTSWEPEEQQSAAIEQLLLRSAPAVFASGSGVIRRLQQRHSLPFAPTTIRICPPAVRDRSKEFSSQQPADAMRMLSVGVLDSEHGTDLLLQAVANLVREGHDVELILTGDGDEPSAAGPSYRSLLARPSANLAQLPERVRFVGELAEDQLMRAYAACDLVCLPYLVDTAAVPCLEGMMFGKAVVASATAATREVLGEEFLFPPGDVGALTSRLRELVIDRERRSRLGTEGRRIYETRFAFDQVLDTTLDAIVECVEAATATPGGNLP